MPTSAEFIEGSNVLIGHLGIVAGAFGTLGIVAIIDRIIPKTRQHHLTYGDIVKAMVLNGLGFVERRCEWRCNFVQLWRDKCVTPADLQALA